MVRRSTGDSGFTSLMRSTNRRYPLSVGTRPELVCGWVMYPSASRTAMSLRTVALDTPRWWRSTSALEPIGSCVAT